MTNKDVEDKPRLGRGNVIVTIDEIEYTLKPSLIAVQTLSRKYGGLNIVVERISKLDFEVICDVVEVGIGRKGNNPRQRQELAEAIFNTGLTDDTGSLGLLCVRYLIILMRGGRPLTQEEEEQFAAEAASGEIPTGNPTSSSNS